LQVVVYKLLPHGCSQEGDKRWNDVLRAVGRRYGRNATFLRGCSMG
jgi:hypothetical protein